MLGVKRFDGQPVKPGDIIVRQKGTRIRPGRGTLLGRDYTIVALREGVVQFDSRKGKKVVEVISALNQ